MSVQVDYVGGADVRVITSAQLLTAGFVSPDLVWNEANNHEIVINDHALAAYLVAADQQFKVQSPPRNFGELVVGEIYNHAAAGLFESMRPKPTTAPAVSNSTTETSLLAEDFGPMPRGVTHGLITRVTAFGLMNNTSGGPIDFTIRVRNQTDGLVFCVNVVTLASDAIGQRQWIMEYAQEVNFFLAEGPHGVSRLQVAKGNTDPMQHAMGQALVTGGTDGQLWRVTGQMSVAHANASITVYGAHVMYSLPGTP